MSCEIPPIIRCLEALDPAAFTVESQTSNADKASFLRIQRLVRSQTAGYAYIEVGSHIGGTLAPHLADPQCYSAISIDPRPSQQDDARGRFFAYDNNSTSRMIEILSAAIPEICLAKLVTFDLDAAQVRHADLPARADLLLIDAEHTTTAAFSDSMSLLPGLGHDAIVSYHDANLVADAIQNLERFLVCTGVAFTTVFLRDNVCAIALRGMAEHVARELRPHALDRSRFLSAARRQVQASIVAEALLRGEVASSPALEAARGDCAALRIELDAARRATAAALASASDQAKGKRSGHGSCTRAGGCRWKVSQHAATIVGF